MIKIPARGGKAAKVAKGQAIKIINEHGHQVVDTWAFNAADISEFLSNEHMHQKLNSLKINVMRLIFNGVASDS